MQTSSQTRQFHTFDRQALNHRMIDYRQTGKIYTEKILPALPGGFA